MRAAEGDRLCCLMESTFRGRSFIEIKGSDYVGDLVLMSGRRAYFSSVSCGDCLQVIVPQRKCETAAFHNSSIEWNRIYKRNERSVKKMLVSVQQALLLTRTFIIILGGWGVSLVLGHRKLVYVHLWSSCSGRDFSRSRAISNPPRNRVRWQFLNTLADVWGVKEGSVRIGLGSSNESLESFDN